MPEGGVSRPAEPSGNKCLFSDNKTISAQDPQVLEKILKALNDIKSEVGFIKKHSCPEQPKQPETQGPQKFAQKIAESTTQSTKPPSKCTGFLACVPR